MSYSFGPALVVVAAIVSGTMLIAFLAFLIFCHILIRQTGSTDGLRDVAVALQAFGGVFGKTTPHATRFLRRRGRSG